MLFSLRLSIILRTFAPNFCDAAECQCKKEIEQMNRPTLVTVA